MGWMQWKREFSAFRARWMLLTLYQKFEHLVITVLTGLIAIVIALAVWTLTVKTLSSVLSTGFDPSEYAVFQILFGMIFTVIIALEFRRSLLMNRAIIAADVRRFGHVNTDGVLGTHKGRL
jgi:hypothetical protein